VDASRWFAVTRTQGASAVVEDVLRELLAMLDEVRPAALDRDRSHVVVDGHDWFDHDVEVLLAHRDTHQADVRLAIGAKDVLLSWSGVHDHIYPEDGSADQPWTAVAADTVAAVLRGKFIVEAHYRGDNLVKTVVVRDGRRVLTIGSPLVLLPFFGRADRVERLTTDFECLG
jgi:hypothetical protein